MGCEDKGIRKSEFVTKTQFLLHYSIDEKGEGVGEIFVFSVFQWGKFYQFRGALQVKLLDFLLSSLAKEIEFLSQTQIF